MSSKKSAVKLFIRSATLADIEDIMSLVGRAYPDIAGYSAGMLQGQLSNYPDGQFVAIYESKRGWHR